MLYSFFWVIHWRHNFYTPMFRNTLSVPFS